MGEMPRDAAGGADRSFRGIAIGLGGPHRPRPSAQLYIGLAIVILGTLFTLDNLDILESEPILQWWPLVVVAFGLSRLLAQPPRRNLALGGLFTGIGLLLLLGSLEVLEFGFWDLWPLGLVFAGAALVRASVQRHRETTNAGGDPSDTVNLAVVMGGITRRMQSQQFRGGEMTAFMGGIELDLRGAKPATDTVVLNALVWWGGVDLRVPTDWKVVSEVMPIMAGVEDSSRADADARTTLIIRGVMVMGGIEVKN